MAPSQTEKGKKPLSSASPPAAVEPAVGRSRVLNWEAMDKVRPVLATRFNEWGGMVAWPTSRPSVDRIATVVQFFIDALCAGLVPPFSAFFNSVLSHYQIHMLHLDPQSVALLVVFAFVCEAMVVAATAGSGIDFELPPSASGFRTRWVYVDVGVLSPLLFPPSAPAVPSSGWGHEKLVSPRLAFVWLRLKRLKDLGLTAPMVMKEFLRLPVDPLQRNSQPMWALSVGQDA
ncbi:hypothetical protein VPH35_098876 [Triticum aestivum]